MTEDSATARKKVSQKSKQSEILPTRGKFTAKKSEPVAGSSPKKFVKNTEHSEAEQSLYNSGFQASSEAATMRQQSRAKATACATDGFLFDKNKRQSFMTESMRSANADKKTCENVHEEADTGRKASYTKNHSSSVFSSSIENRPLKAINAKNNQTGPSMKDGAAAKLASEGRIASDDAENARRHLQARQGRSSVFSSSSSSDPQPQHQQGGGKMCASRPSSSIFGGGAWADDARKLAAPRPSAAPAAPPAGFGDNSTARCRRDAGLRGSGGLW